MCFLGDDTDATRKCIAEHITPVLKLTEARHAGKWNGFCPAHGDTKKSLVISLGDRWPFIWRCHKQPQCQPWDVRTAMLSKGIKPECIPWSGRKSALKPEPVEVGDPRLAALAQELIDRKASGTEWRLRMTMQLHGVDDRTAADMLKLPPRTYYKVRPKSA